MKLKTQQFVRESLSSVKSYQNTKTLTQKLSEDKLIYESVCLGIKEVLESNAVAPISKLLAVRLCKELVDQQNPTFLDIFEKYAEIIKPIALFDKDKPISNRGANYFNAEDKELRQVGMSLVRLALDCVKAWAMFFPTNSKGDPSQYYLIYRDVLAQIEHFPQGVYYSETIMLSRKNDQFDRLNCNPEVMRNAVEGIILKTYKHHLLRQKGNQLIVSDNQTLLQTFENQQRLYWKLEEENKVLKKVTKSKFTDYSKIEELLAQKTDLAVKDKQIEELSFMLHQQDLQIRNLSQELEKAFGRKDKLRITLADTSNDFIFNQSPQSSPQSLSPSMGSPEMLPDLMERKKKVEQL